MAKKTLRLLANFSYDHFGKAATVMLAVSIFFEISSGAAHRISSQRLENKEVAEIAGVKFVPPQGFTVEQFSNTEVAYMRHATNQLALFVAVPGKKVDNEYFTNLANILVSHLMPQKNNFSWKTLPRGSDRKVSVHQIAAGTVKGLSERKFVQTDYIVLKAQGHNVVIGSIASFGDEHDAKFLFEAKGREYSFPGWSALFEIIPSITGEKTNRD